MKTIDTTTKNMMGVKTPETVYHLRCEKCGDLCSRRCYGNATEGQIINNES